MTSDSVIHARDYIDSSNVILRSAELVTAEVLDRLSAGGAVTLSMSGMPPVSSSYFNVMLQRVVERYGIEALENLRLATSSKLLEGVFQRSKSAVIAHSGNTSS